MTQRKKSGKTALAAKPRRKRSTADAEEELFRAAFKYLLFNHGMFLVPTGIRDMRIRGIRVWIFTVTLRYTTGHEGYVGDLLYDGKDFRFLSEQSVMDARVHEIANDPERQRLWDEYRDSTLQARAR